MDNVLTHNAVCVCVQLDIPGVRIHGDTAIASRQFGIRAGLTVGPGSSASFKDNISSPTERWTS